MNSWLSILFLGMGAAQVLQWIKELAAYAAVKIGRFVKMLLALLIYANLTIWFSPGGWRWDVVFFLGLAAVGSLTHAALALAQAMKDSHRLGVESRISPGAEMSRLGRRHPLW